MTELYNLGIRRHQEPPSFVFGNLLITPFLTQNSILFLNPKGIASHSPWLPSLRGYPGSQAATFSSLKGLRLLAASDVASYLHTKTKTQPHWGCDRNEQPPRVVASLQPWALRRNPFGIQEFPHPEMWVMTRLKTPGFTARSLTRSSGPLRVETDPRQSVI